MPAIPVPPIYEQRTSASDAGPGPGPSGFAGSGYQALGGAINNVGKAIDIVQQRDDVATAGANLAALRMNAEKSFSDAQAAAADNAQGFTPAFMKTFDDLSKNALDGIKTPEVKRSVKAQLQQIGSEVYGKALAFENGARQSQRIDQVDRSIINVGGAVELNPDSWQSAGSEQSSIIDHLGIDPTQRLLLKRKLDETVSEAAGRGYANLDPEGTMKRLTDPHDPLFAGMSAKIRNSTLGYAITVQNANELRDRRAEALKVQLLKQEQQKTQNDFLDRMTHGQLSTSDILHSNLSPFGEGSKEQMLNMLKANIDKPVKTDPATFNALFNRIHLQDGDPQKIVDENTLNQYVPLGKLSLEDVRRLRDEISGNQTADGAAEAELKKGMLDIAKSTLTKSNPLIGLQDPQGDTQLQRFTTYFLNEYKTQRKAGKTPQQLLDPGSPDYLGKRLSAYARSPQQIMNDMVNGLNAGGTAQQPTQAGGDLPQAGLRVPGTITNLFNRPILYNPDGGYSTTSSMSFGTDKGEVLIPTVIDGKRLTKADAIAHYRKTGEHLGIFDTPAHADAYAEALHNQQAQHIESGNQLRTVVRTGTQNGKKVVQYSDGSVEYAN